ncbi:MAG: alkaline phosphatase family protein, partial [Solirubrobacterales bacterium]
PRACPFPLTPPRSDPPHDTAGGARASADGPYLATTLTKAGALVPDLFGVTRGSLAAQVALVSGQGPNPATREDCPSFSEVSTGEPGKYDQAPGSGCGYPANYATIADLLTGAQKRWKVYAGVGDRLDGGAPALCRQPVPGSRPATGALPFPLFASFTGDPECSTKVASTAALAEDTASKEKTPAFSFVLPGPCEDASDRPCQDGSPAGVAPANAFLRRTVEAIRDSAAYKAGGAIVITASQSAAGGENPDNSACCEDRPWYGKNISTSGGGRVGALVLSPLVKGGTVIDGRFDHYDLLRTIADGLGVRRPGLAAHPKVTGLPRGTWSAWNGKKPAAAKPVE